LKCSEHGSCAHLFYTEKFSLLIIVDATVIERAAPLGFVVAIASSLFVLNEHQGPNRCSNT